MNKNKSNKKLKVKTDRLKISSAKNRKKKSPTNTILNKNALEKINRVSIDEIFTRNSIGRESNASQPEKFKLNKVKSTSKVPQGTDFLSFVEEKEGIARRNKEKRASILAADSTNAGTSNVGKTLSKKTKEMDPGRPLSGGPPKHTKVKSKKLIKKKA